MIAVGIPTLNEATNISALVQTIDRFSLVLGCPLTIINCDNTSEDGTSALFAATPTANKKIALTTTQPGKGRNVKKIVEYVVKHDIEYCLFIDGDVTSVELSWLEQHKVAAKSRFDYVVPRYSRHMHEGNTTNHFAYPLLQHATSGQSPRQPIAGDFGVSLAFARHLDNLKWPISAQGYGVDIFMTMHALLDGFRVTEIALGSKLHKPSYDKMVGMFTEVAESYYTARLGVASPSAIHFSSTTTVGPDLLTSALPPVERITASVNLAQTLLRQNARDISLPRFAAPANAAMSALAWARVLTEHEKLLGVYSPHSLSVSLTPFYLLRVTTYLHEITDPHNASRELTLQAQLIHEAFSNQGL